MTADIAAAGGAAEAGKVNVLDEAAVDEHADAVVAKAGGIDISFNAVAYGDVQRAPLADMSLNTSATGRRRAAGAVPDRTGGSPAHDQDVDRA